jgi:hypothetical protein
MPRAAISVADSTAMLSSFVMGAELLLLFVYIRTQILVAIKRKIYFSVRDELTREDRFLGTDTPLKRLELERIHSLLCVDSYDNSAMLATLGYVLATVALVVILSKASPSNNPDTDALTTLAATSAGLVFFLGSQWGFLKLGILPFYADLYNRFTGQNIPLYEADSASVTLVLLGPTILSAFVFVIAGLAGFQSIAWALVAVTLLFSVLGLGTELVAWFLMRGFAVPVTDSVSALTDAITAVLWVNQDNSPEIAIKRLAQSLFPDNTFTMTTGNIFKHVYRDNFARKRLEVTDYGALVVRDAPSNRLRAAVMLGCAACLLLAPFVALAARAPPGDAVVVIAQIVIIAFAYWIYILNTGGTATMLRLTFP